MYVIFIFQIIDTENIEYDPKIGYTFTSPLARDSGTYRCVVNEDNIPKSQEFNVSIKRKLFLLHRHCEDVVFLFG